MDDYIVLDADNGIVKVTRQSQKCTMETLAATQRPGGFTEDTENDILPEQVRNEARLWWGGDTLPVTRGS